MDRNWLVEHIAGWRRDRHMTQRELSRAMGKDKDWCRRIESGRAMRIDVLDLIKLGRILKFKILIQPDEDACC